MNDIYAYDPDTEEEAGQCVDEVIQWDEQHEVQAIFLVSVSRQKNKKLQDFYATTARLLLDEQRIGQLIQKRSYQTLAECLEAVDNERTE